MNHLEAAQSFRLKGFEYLGCVPTGTYMPLKNGKRA